MPRPNLERSPTFYKRTLNTSSNATNSLNEKKTISNTSTVNIASIGLTAETQATTQSLTIQRIRQQHQQQQQRNMLISSSLNKRLLLTSNNSINNSNIKQASFIQPISTDLNKLRVNSFASRSRTQVPLTSLELKPTTVEVFFRSSSSKGRRKPVSTLSIPKITLKS
jgi:hypothetical protein